MCRLAPGLLPLALGVMGCSVIGRATLMPTVDTNGAVGVCDRARLRIDWYGLTQWTVR